MSVLVPTYNAARWLPTTIPPVLAQTLDDFELVVSDNCSEDATVEVVEELARRDRRVRLVRQDRNLGLRGNCEALVGEAVGRHVKLLMADDVLLPTALERLSGALDDPGVTLATARRVRIDPDGTVLPDDIHTTPLAVSSSVLDGSLLAEAVLEHQANFVGEPSVTMFRRSDVDAATMFTIGSQRFGTVLDVVAWLRLLVSGDCYYDAEILSGFTQHDSQTGRNPANQMLEATEWAALLRLAPQLGYLVDPRRRARAYATYLRRWAAVPLDDPAGGFGAVARDLSWCASELASLHDRFGATPTAAYEDYRATAQDGGRRDF